MADSMLYVAVDGSYGNAQGLRLLPAALVDNEMTEGEIVDLAQRVGTLVALKPRTLWSLHIDDNDTFETTLHGSREEAVAARRAFMIDQGYLSSHPDDTDYTSDGELVTVITEHTVSPPSE